jgi:cell division protein YceG involved in septum cleavage
VRIVTRRLLVPAILVLVFLAGIAWLAQRALHDPLKLPPAGYLLDVPMGSSLQSVATRLQAEGILPYPMIVVAYGRITGMAGAIRAGSTRLLQEQAPTACCCCW